MIKQPTLTQWKRRALKAEAELESIRKVRNFNHEFEIKMHRDIATLRVAMNEIKRKNKYIHIKALLDGQKSGGYE